MNFWISYIQFKLINLIYRKLNKNLSYRIIINIYFKVKLEENLATLEIDRVKFFIKY